MKEQLDICEPETLLLVIIFDNMHFKAYMLLHKSKQCSHSKYLASVAQNTEN